MATTPKPKPRPAGPGGPKPKGDFLTRKVGPFPVWAWLAIVGGGVTLGLVLRHRLASSGGAGAGATTSTPAAPSPAPDLGAGGGGGVGPSVGPDASGLPFDLEAALEAAMNGQQQTIGALTGTLQGFGGGLVDLAEQTNAAGVQAEQNAFTFAQGAFGTAAGLVQASAQAPPSTQTNIYVASPTQPNPPPAKHPVQQAAQPAFSPVSAVTQPIPSGPVATRSYSPPAPYNPPGTGTIGGAAAQLAQSYGQPSQAVGGQAGGSPGRATAGGPAFGGVVSVKTLPSGAKLTTYGSGRQVEQAPGKSSYVVHK